MCRAQPVIDLVFCIDSWMGWNATQHLSNAGYSNVHWFPQGTDDWERAGYPLVVVDPIPEMSTEWIVKSGLTT